MNWRRAGRSRSTGEHAFPHAFTTRLPSGDQDIDFHARIRYELTPDPDQQPALHPHAVARSLLRDHCASATTAVAALDLDEANDRANEALSRPITADPRLTVTGAAEVGLRASARRLARRNLAVQHRLHEAEYAQTVHLEHLRQRLTDPGLGLAWWIDQHAATLWATSRPGQSAADLVAAFDALHTAMARRSLHRRVDPATLVHARVDEILAVLEDPMIAPRAAEVLEQLVSVIHDAQRQPTPTP